MYTIKRREDGVSRWATAIYVPIEGTKLYSEIRRGSAILGQPSERQMFQLPGKSTVPAINIWYQSEKIGFPFAKECADIYLRRQYKLSGLEFMTVSPFDFQQVGTWDMDRKNIEVADLELLADWCNWQLPVDERELTL